MRALSKILASTLTLLILMMTPLMAAAASLDAAPQIGPAPLLAALGLVGLGTVITLKARDATGNKKTFALDTEKPAEMSEVIDQVVELRTEEATAPLHATITRLKSVIQLLREKMAAEIMRVETLAAPRNDKGETQYDAEAQKTYYLGDNERHIEPLQAERLCLEFDKAVRTEVKVPAATTSEEPGDTPTKDDPYAVALKAAGYEPEKSAPPAKTDA